MVMKVVSFAPRAASWLLVSVPVDGFVCGMVGPPARRTKVAAGVFLEVVIHSPDDIIEHARLNHAPDTSSTLC